MRKTVIFSAALLALGLGLSACKGSSLSKDDCEKLIDHMTDVEVKGQGADLSPDLIKAAKDAAKSQMKGMVDECTKEGTRAEFDCAMAANDVAAMEKCTK